MYKNLNYSLTKKDYSILKKKLDKALITDIDYLKINFITTS